MISGVKIDGSKFARKEFIVCEDNDDIVKAYNIFIDKGHQCKVSKESIKKLEAGRGKLVYVSPTLMKWGFIKIYPNTVNKRNRLLLNGYEEVEI